MIDYLAELDKRGLEPNTDVSKGSAFISCPFHSENTPSCDVALSHGQFFCHGCKEGGSFYKLIAQVDGISIRQAKLRLWDDSDTEQQLVTWKKKLQAAEQIDKPTYYSWCSFKQKFKDVQTSRKGMEYLGSRGIDRETAIRFGLRIGQIGRYKDRIILPVVSPDGKLITYTARTILDGVKPKTRKAHSRFRKLTLFGIHALDVSRRYKNIILVEGEFDDVFLMQRGYPALGAMGTSELSSEQIALLVSLTDGVILCYDDDEAGKKACKVNSRKLKPYIDVSIVELSDNKDPDELSSEELDEAFGAFEY